MGTYIYAQLKDTSEENILKQNKILHKLGVETKEFNGVLYGAFVSRTQLEEDARYMNEESEGLKQAPHWQRPITVKMLERVFWNKIGLFCTKLSGGSTEEELSKALIVALYIRHNRSLFNIKACSNHTVTKVKEYFEDDDVAKAVAKKFTAAMVKIS
jgi:hypothetical protein